MIADRDGVFAWQGRNVITQLLPVEPFELDAVIEFGKIQSKLRQIGKPTGEIDALIAAVA